MLSSWVPGPMFDNTASIVAYSYAPESSSSVLKSLSTDCSAASPSDVQVPLPELTDQSSSVRNASKCSMRSTEPSCGSHTSPTPSWSPSCCVGFGSPGQLSQVSVKPSPSSSWSVSAELQH